MASDNTLTIKRIVNADRKTIFEAFTNKEILGKWFFAGDEQWSVTVQKHEPKVGGEYHFDMNSPENTYWHKGEFKEVVPNEKLVFTWNTMAVQNTVVTIALKEVNGGTEVELTHEFMPDEEMRDNHLRGWNIILDRLEKLMKD